LEKKVRQTIKKNLQGVNHNGMPDREKGQIEKIGQLQAVQGTNQRKEGKMGEKSNVSNLKWEWQSGGGGCKKN